MIFFALRLVFQAAHISLKRRLTNHSLSYLNEATALVQ